VLFDRRLLLCSISVPAPVFCCVSSPTSGLLAARFHTSLPHGLLYCKTEIAVRSRYKSESRRDVAPSVPAHLYYYHLNSSQPYLQISNLPSPYIYLLPQTNARFSLFPVLESLPSSHISSIFPARCRHGLLSQLPSSTTSAIWPFIRPLVGRLQ
jgi:hypothetical protein